MSVLRTLLKEMFLQAASVMLPINQEIREKIEDLAAQGIVRTRDVKVLLQASVKEMFQNHKPPPFLNRRYHPSDTDIQNIIYK